MNDSRLASMPPEELRDAMDRLQLETHSDLARTIGVNRSTVTLWAQGKVGVPRPIAMLLRLLVTSEELRAD